MKLYSIILIIILLINIQLLIIYIINIKIMMDIYILNIVINKVLDINIKYDYLYIIYF